MSGLSKFPSEASTSQEGQGNRKLKITLLSRAWRSSIDGDLSTINRELAIQLAKHPSVEVSVFLPQCSEEDKNNAASCDVQLIKVEEGIGSAPVDWLINVPDGHIMDFVIGHGITLGKQAQVIRKYHQCKWIQVVSTVPEERGVYQSISQSQQLQEKEVALCKKADQVIAIGPKLTDAYKHYLRGSKNGQNVFDLTPGIFSEFLVVEQAAEERQKFSVLVSGSGDCCEDFILKGFGLAAQAIAELKDKSYQLRFVGAPREKVDEIKDKLLQNGIDCSQLIVRSFSDSREELANLFCEVDLAILPSKIGEFGITALQALSAGLPVLVSGNSGLGEALKEVLFGRQLVVYSEKPEAWAEKIKDVRSRKRQMRLCESSSLCKLYQERYPWEESIGKLVERMYNLIIVKGSSGGHFPHSVMEYGCTCSPSSYNLCDSRSTGSSFTQENRPSVGDKRPAHIVLGDHHSKQSRRELVNSDCHEGLRGSSGDQVQDISKSKKPDITTQCQENPKLAESPEELVELIRRKCEDTVLCPFLWCKRGDQLSFELSKIFTRLTIFRRKRERAKLTEKSVKMAGVFKPLKMCECERECECKRKNPRMVLIEGPPGMGKTIYCQKLAYDWSVGKIEEESFPKVDMVLRLTCRDMKNAKIVDAIRDQLLPSEKNKKKLSHFIDQNQKRILLMLDGLDELPEDVFKGLSPFFEGKEFPFIYVVLTARHEAGREVRRSCDALFEIVGYNKEDADSYIKKYFSSDETSKLAEKLIEAIDKDSQLRKLTANALNTALLCLVFEEGGGVLPYNRTMLYSKLVKCVLKIHCAKKKILLKEQDPEEEFLDHLNQLGKFALEALLKGQSAFTLEEPRSQVHKFLELGFLSREACVSRINPKPTYAFMHGTFQQYFAAFHLVHESQTVHKDRALLEKLTVDKYWQVWTFLITMAASKSDDAAELWFSSICAAFQGRKPEQLSWDEDYKMDDTEEEHSNDDDVCKDAKYNWWLWQQKSSDFLFLQQIVDIVAQCEQFESETKPCQVKIARTLAGSFPIDVIEVSCSYRSTTFSPRFPSVLAEYLKWNSKLNKLAWKLDASAAEALAGVLQTTCTLTHLRLMNGSCLTLLTSCLQANHTVTHLDMQSAGVGDVEAEELRIVLQSNDTLTHLCLADNKISHVGVEALVEALKSNRVLENLNIGDNDIGEKGVEALSQALEFNRTLRCLNVCGRLSPLRFGDRGLKAIARALRSNSSLSYLDIHKFSFMDPSLAELGMALQSNYSLTHLFVGGGYSSQSLFSSLSAETFSKALELPDTQLTRLDLRGTSITTSCVTILAGAIGVNGTLERLDLSQNHIDCPGAGALAQGLKTNQTLTHLQLKENKIGDVGAKEFAQVLPCNKTLMSLGLKNNPMTKSGRDLLEVFGSRVELKG